QHPRQGVDLGLGPGRQVGQGPVLDLAGFPVALAQQDRRRRAAVRHPDYVHDHDNSQLMSNHAASHAVTAARNVIYMTTLPSTRERDSPGQGPLTALIRGSSGGTSVYRYAVEEELLDHSPAVHVRRPRLDYESHATGLDRKRARRDA